MGAEPREAGEAAGVLRRAGEVAARHGLHLAVRNEGTSASAASLAALVREVDHPAVSALWSVASSRAAGEAPPEAAEALAGAPLALVEADEAFAEADPEASGLTILAQSGFDGPVALAFGGPPQEGLMTSTALIRGLRRAKREAAGASG